MRITLDTDKKYLIVPDNFFEKMIALNAFREENGVPAISPIAYVRESFEKAMSNPETCLKRKSDVLVKRKSKQTKQEP